MQKQVVIKVEGIGKRYQVGANTTYLTFRDKITELPKMLFKPKSKLKYYYALKDISFEVKRGSILGILGKNGAGKSTLLKILSRVTEPSSGKVTMNGRVASMLEVGTGFNPELTGRENIYLNGAIIGMKIDEIKTKFDDIANFAGVHDFLDTPVKHYSSGMYVRLAFAVAAHLDADILLIDEVLAVGDTEFQNKCLGKISELTKSGRTVVFVSHNMNFMESLSTSVIILNDGKLDYYGNPKQAIKKYLRHIVSRSNSFSPRLNRAGNGKCRVVDCYLVDKNGAKSQYIRSGEEVGICIKYERHETINYPLTLSINISDSYKKSLILHRTDFNKKDFFPKKTGIVKCIINKLPLVRGFYYLGIEIDEKNIVVDAPGDVLTFNVESGDYFGTGHQGFPDHSPILIEANWEIN